MGVVYLAEDSRLNRQVAIKTVELSLDDPSQREFLRNRLLRDAQAAAALSHPNIVPVYDVIEDANAAYVVMEYVAGESLAARLRRTGRPEPAFVLRVLREMAAALDYTHARGVIHRDIKPGNVMIAAAGSAKIMDFGIARIVDSRTNTPTGMVMGTIHYMAPEQIKGEPLDGRCDQFALAAVAYEMLSGVTLFGAQSLATLAYKLVNEDPAPVRSRNSELPEAVDTVLRKALAKQPEQRFTTCGEFVSALEAVFAGRPTLSGFPMRDTPTETLGPAALAAAAAPASSVAAAGRKQRGGVGLAAVAAIVLAAAAGAVVVWKPWAAPRPAAPVAAPQQSLPPKARSRPEAAESHSAPENPQRRSTAKPVRTGEAARMAETTPANSIPSARPEREPQPEAEPGPAPAEDAGPVPGEKVAGPALAAWRQGNEFEAGGDHKGAIAAYTKAIAAKPGYGAAYMSRGLAHFHEKDFANAAQDFSAAIGIFPNHPVGYVWRGNARVQLGQMDEALRDYNRAIELNPKLPGGWNGRGMIYYRRGEFRKALADLDEAIRLAPRQALFYNNRASTRHQLGDRAGAQTDRQRARELLAQKEGEDADAGHRN